MVSVSLNYTERNLVQIILSSVQLFYLVQIWAQMSAMNTMSAIERNQAWKQQICAQLRSERKTSANDRKHLRSFALNKF